MPDQAASHQCVGFPAYRRSITAVRKPIFFTLLIFLLVNSVHLAGQTRAVTGTFQGLSFDEFIQQLERQTGYNFYYEPKSFDSLRVTLVADNKPLHEVFDSLFNRTDYHYAIHQHRVFLTRGRRIYTSLPGHPAPSIKQGEGKTPQVALTDLLADWYPEADAPQASLENKLYEIGSKTAPATGHATIRGYAVDAKTGEPVVGAAVFIEQPRTGITTDKSGFFALTIPRGRHILYIRGLGIRNTSRQIMLYSDGMLNLEIQPEVTSLREVVISEEHTANVKNVQMGVEKISIATIKQVPAVFGEADVLRTVLALPGVKSAGEASTGLNVRGGTLTRT